MTMPRESGGVRGPVCDRAPARRLAKAMTLVEVLAVVVILGLLAATLAAGFSGAFAKGKRELAKTGIGVVCSKLELYKIDHSAWPSNDEGLALLTDGRAAPSAPYYLGPDQLMDPWGRRYLYVVPGPDGHPYEVLSYGADGQPGGEGEGEDLSSAHLRRGEGERR
jgi:general secretion pathway protein G